MKIQILAKRIPKVGIANTISLITSCNWIPAWANRSVVLGRIRSKQVKVEGLLLLLQVAHGIVLPLRAYPVEKPLSSTPLAPVGLARMCQVPSAHAEKSGPTGGRTAVGRPCMLPGTSQDDRGSELSSGSPRPTLTN